MDEVGTREHGEQGPEAVEQGEKEKDRLSDLDITDAQGGKVKGGIPPRIDPNGSGKGR